ncbi:hemolysin family protein [Nocardioides sp. BP30]|uniref:hemolysin family protein n=1 Tax=Nocardioides sp. BP30 TaxID=3036374 RepID=UPI002468A88F|nr:hemolysin family protein [Nocardioides sp. BP30]WGL50576.1 hemolysin family protein [Nocardioides sp. BP30]
MSTPLALLLALVLLLLNAFFVATEFALVSARRSQIEPQAIEGSRLARRTLEAMEDVASMIAGIQLGVTVCSVILGAVAEPAVSHVIAPLLHAVHVPEGAVHPIAFVVALALVAFLHVVLGEMVPKNITLALPERAVLVLAPIMYALVRLLRPLIVVLDATARAALRLVRVEPKHEVVSAFTREEVAAMVEESRGEGLLQQNEYDRLAGALGFTEKTVADVLLPVGSLTTVRRGASGADIEALCAATGFSRFPVEDDRVANGAGPELLGYLHIKDVLEPDEVRRQRPVEDKWIRPFATVTPTDPLHEALETLQRRGSHLARVVDLDGVTIGLATLEDVIEELVGEIRDAAHADEVPSLQE